MLAKTRGNDLRFYEGFVSFCFNNLFQQFVSTIRFNNLFQQLVSTIGFNNLLIFVCVQQFVDFNIWFQQFVDLCVAQIVCGMRRGEAATFTKWCAVVVFVVFVALSPWRQYH